MKHLLSPSLLLLGSLAMLNLGVLAADADKPVKGKKASDNTAKNERDRSGRMKTPLDQSNRPEDIKTTQMIRKAVMADDALSTNGKNVKIITAAGKVTLRGPVASTAECDKIIAHARKHAGKMSVVNQLEVNTASK